MHKRALAVAIGLTLASGGVAEAVPPPARTVPLSNAAGAYLVKVNINGYKALMQVDTGATSSVIDLRIARELDLAPQGDPVKGQSVGCTTSAQPVAIRNWTVGTVPLPDLDIAAIRSPGKIPTYKGLPVVGLLGNDVLASFETVGVDFADRRLVLGGAFPQTGRQLQADVVQDKSGAIALFTATVSVGEKTATFAVDTGAALSVVDRGAARELGLRTTKRKVRIQAVGCNVKASPVLIRRWKSGRVNLPTEIGLSRPGLPAGLDGLLGASVLSHFGQVTFDYVGRHVALGFPVPDGSTPAPAPVTRVASLY